MKLNVPWGGDKTIEKVAEDAIVWAEGSWGQSQYDKPRFSHEAMYALYMEMAKICHDKALLHETK